MIPSCRHPLLCSVAHYIYVVYIVCRFDISWLKDEHYHTEKGIMSDKKLSDDQKKILLGIHQRHQSLALEPSDTDIRFLAKSYQKSNIF